VIDGARDAISVVQGIGRILLARGGVQPAEVNDPSVGWSPRPEEGVWVPTADNSRIRICAAVVGGGGGVTVLRPTLRVFSGIAPGVDLIAQTILGGARFLAVVHGAEAPARLNFALSLAKDHGLESMPSGGVDVITLGRGTTIGRFSRPSATDSWFRTVDTAHELQHEALVLRTDHGRDTTYPLVIDFLYAAR
jgi:hypothetical protein